MSKTEIEIQQRMYVLVPYNISPIQAGIQALHAVVEYANKFFHTNEYKQWSKHDKTVIILNGGTTNNDLCGTLNHYEILLDESKIPHATFHEPDLNDALTGVAFLADSRVYDKNQVAEFDSSLCTFVPGFSLITLLSYSDIEIPIPNFDDKNELALSAWKQYLDEIGGRRNAFLREFLRPLKLANN